MNQIYHPDYYNTGGFEVIDFINALNLNFNLGNVFKYIARGDVKTAKILSRLSEKLNGISTGKLNDWRTPNDADSHLLRL